MAHTNVDLGLLQETNITNRFYVQESSVSPVVAADAPSRHSAVMELFYKESPRFALESHQQHGPNTICFQLVTGGQFWYVMGCYLVPGDASTLESAIAAIFHRLRGTYLLAVCYFKTYM